MHQENTILCRFQPDSVRPVTGSRCKDSSEDTNGTEYGFYFILKSFKPPTLFRGLTAATFLIACFTCHPPLSHYKPVNCCLGNKGKHHHCATNKKLYELLLLQNAMILIDLFSSKRKQRCTIMVRSALINGDASLI